MTVEGIVFNIQRFSIHDGPGIRTTVFLKGCNLHCAWCHNPESRSTRQEIQSFSQKCVLCKKCIEVCPQGAFTIQETDGMPSVKLFDRSVCDGCGLCVDNCSYDALVYVAKTMTVEQVVEEVLKDADYYRTSGGGMTISGGEPMLQKDFICALFGQLHALGIHTALDTAAQVPWKELESVLPVVDLLLLDLKSMDSDVHQHWTGVGNARILENARRLAASDVDLIIRIPVVPGVNATRENMDQTAIFLQNFPRLRYVELLPYHDMGMDKYDSLGKEHEMINFESPSPEHMIWLAESFHNHNVQVKVQS